MKKIKLHRLEVKNFMNTDVVIEPKGGHLAVYGCNGSGKTTAINAITYLFDNKNYENKRDFEIKTLNENGEVIHGMEHTVEGVFEINGQIEMFKKNYSETYKKKIGTSEKQFGSNNTEYFINGVSTTMTDYQAYLNTLVPENLFRLLISPTGFNDLHWTERRKILLDGFGNVTDSEIITLNPALSVVPEILEGNPIDDVLPVLKKKFTLTQKEQKKVKLLLGEAKHKIPEELLETLGEARMKEKLASLIEQLKALRGQLEKLVHNPNRDKLREARNRAQEQVDALTRKQQQLQGQKNDLELQMVRLRSKWEAKNEETFSFNDLLTCPLCDQDIPETSRMATREKALDRFRNEKQEHLENISAEGKKAAAQLEQTNDEMKELTQQLTVFTQGLKKTEQELAQLTSTLTQEEKALRDKITALDTQEAGLRDKLAYALAAEQARQRVNELENDFDKLENDCHLLEGQIMALEEFNRVKMQLLQDRVNHHFALARFRLFKKLVSGDMVECCETLYNGVPYNTNLNHGHRIQVGMDIINALSKRFGITMPLLVDNRESVDQLPPTNSQVISLFVSPKDSVLRSERDQSIRDLSQFQLGEDDNARQENKTVMNLDSLVLGGAMPLEPSVPHHHQSGPGF